MTAQHQLVRLYEKYWPTIQACMKKYRRLSAPTVMMIPDSYFAAKRRLMIIGQQTDGWDKDDDLQELLKGYKEFNFGEHYRYHGSPFWSVTGEIATILEISPYAIAWTNLVKCDLGRKRPSEVIEDEVQAAFPVLRQEITILGPDILLFFTGPYYDDRLLRTFPGADFTAVPGFAERKLARIVGHSLPKLSFRTYHPRYLRQSKLEHRVLKYLRSVV